MLDFSRLRSTTETSGDRPSPVLPAASPRTGEEEDERNQRLPASPRLSPAVLDVSAPCGAGEARRAEDSIRADEIGLECEIVVDAQRFAFVLAIPMAQYERTNLFDLLASAPGSCVRAVRLAEIHGSLSSALQCEREAPGIILVSDR